MMVIDSSYEILTEISDGGKDELRAIENAARTCYKSEAANANDDFDKTKRFIKGLINRGHEAMLEHSFLSVKFTCDRGVSHEIVRHRHFSFAQESTRYCDYTNEAKCPGDIIFIRPFWYNDAPFNDQRTFDDFLLSSESVYRYLRSTGHSPQECRAVLPNAVKTELVVSGNYREWRHFFKLRAAETTGQAHPDMKKLAFRLLEDLYTQFPVIFDDVYESVSSQF